MMNKSFAIVLAAQAILVATACSRDARLVDQNLHSATVQSVTLYGETLDKNASPEKVAYVALRAVRDDFLAKTKTERDEALDKEFAVCAADEIARGNRTSLSRDEWIYQVVYHWTPTISHYVGDFPTTWEQAKTRLINRKIETVADHRDGAKRCELAMVVNDPGGDPNARVVLLVWLELDKGFWRVTHFGFDRTRRSLGDQRASTSP